jgi:hypothetical protein
MDDSEPYTALSANKILEEVKACRSSRDGVRVGVCLRLQHYQRDRAQFVCAAKFAEANGKWSAALTEAVEGLYPRSQRSLRRFSLEALQNIMIADDSKTSHDVAFYRDDIEATAGWLERH